MTFLPAILEKINTTLEILLTDIEKGKELSLPCVWGMICVLPIYTKVEFNKRKRFER